MKKWLAGAAVAATIGGAGAGAALLNAPIVARAQSSSTTAPERTAPPWMTEALNKLVDAGTINQSQADSVSQALVAARPEGGRHGPGGPKGGMRRSIVASAIGIDEATLRVELRSGKTIAQVAQAHGVDVQKVVDALVAELKTRLAARVAAGRITQAHADEKLANAPARITDMVNNAPPAHGRHGPGRPGSGPWPSTPPTTTG